MSSSGLQKHERETIKAVESLARGIKARIETRRGGNAHSWVVLEIQGHEVHRHSVASSPTNAHTMVRAVTRECRKALQEKGILSKPDQRPH